LNGETINLPPNVNFDFDGGDIFNGKLVFSGGYIDGRLLNYKLEIEGDARLKDPTFNFKPSRWEIVEGQTTQPIAFRNHEIIQEVVDTVKEMGAETFNINKLDAFFDSDDQWNPVVFLPSGFHFKMSNNTHLRIFPSDRNRFTTRLFFIYKQNDITISGGNLYGDRDLHGSNAAARTGVLIWISSGQNILVENVKLSFAGSAGLTINSAVFPYTNPGYVPSKFVTVTGCIFDSNRSNNLSVTDGEDITIEKCEFYRAGISTPFSNGLSPISGIDVEPDDGQRIERVTISDNLEREGAGASFIASGGNEIKILNNDLESPLAWNAASNVHVIGNTLQGGLAAGLKSAYALSKSVGNIVSGNTIMNSKTGTGIAARNDDIKIFDNNIINCTVGIQLDGLEDSEIYNNTITSNIEVSFGFNAIDYVDNVIVRNNTIELPGRALFLDLVNLKEEDNNRTFTFKDNIFNTGNFANIKGTFGLSLINNTSTSGFGISDSKNIVVHKNTITTGSPFCILVSRSGSSQNVEITENILENTDGFGQGPGIFLNSFGDNLAVEDSNFVVRGNRINVQGTNNAIRVKDFDGVTLDANIGVTNNNSFINYRGNNGSITQNTNSSANPNVIEGTNNTVVD